MSGYVKVIKGTGEVKRVYAADLTVAAFNPSLYGEVDPRFMVVVSDTPEEMILAEVPDEEILAAAIEECLTQLHAIRTERLDGVINDKTMSIGVSKAYELNEQAALEVMHGDPNGRMCMSPSGDYLTYKEYLEPKGLKLGFPSVEAFAYWVLYEVYYTKVNGSAIEEEYYVLKTQAEHVTITTNIDDAIEELHAIVASWEV